MSIYSTLKFVLNHPLNQNRKLAAFWVLVKWFINVKINPYPVIVPYAERSHFIMHKGLTGATGNLFCGLHEFQDMAFLLHFLRPDDKFVDIGANVGSYTILGASEIEAQTTSFEPIPDTFKILESNILINRINDRVTALNIGLGATKGTLEFTKSQGPVNHVATENEKDTISVPVEVFDNIINIDHPTLIKIDVEGFETEVLKGMSMALANDNLKAIIIELNGSGKRYGYDDAQIHKKLLSNGFNPFRYDPFNRKLYQLENHGSENTIYIKDLMFIQNRISTAKKIRIHNREF